VFVGWGGKGVPSGDQLIESLATKKKNSLGVKTKPESVKV